MNKLYLVIISILLVFGSVSIALTRGDDEIRISGPINGSVISGNLTLNWYIRDQEQTQFKSVVDVFSKSCPNNGDYYGTIDDNIIYDLPSGGKEFQFIFNTYSALQNKSSLEDGEYCLRVCGDFIERTNYKYSMCETTSITIANFNKPPKILSKVTKTSYKVGDSFSYQINASDADGDKLKYTLINNPNFIVINSDSGLITSKGSLAEKGAFTIKYRVEDPKGAFVEDVFTINIADVVVINNQVEFITPTKDEIFSDIEEIQIKWQINNQKSQKSALISLSQDANRWSRLNLITNNKTEYLWDITDVDSGTYYLKLDVEFTDNTKYSLNSDEFSIDRSSGKVPYIQIISPEEDEIITDNNQVEVKVQVLISEEAVDIGQVRFLLDEVDLTDQCRVETDNVICNSFELKNGKHKINFYVKDLSDKQNQAEWFFEIDYEGENDGETNGTDNTSNDTGNINLDELDWQTILTYVCGGGGVLALIAIVIASIKKLFGKKNDDYPFVQNSENQVTYDVIGSQTLENNPQPMNYNNSGFSVPEYQPVDNTVPIVKAQDSLPSSYNNPTNQVQMPTAYQSDDIPDWLKDVDADKPVGFSGQSYDNNNSSVNKQSGDIDDYARPHEG